MIKITEKTAQKVKAKKSLFVSFPYSMERVEKIKSLPKRYYVPATKEWEIPKSSLNDLIAMFQDEQIKIEGPVTSKIEKTIENRVTFDNVDPNGFKFKTKPFDHQLEGFKYGLNHNKFLLGDEQGLGKTKQAIDIAVARKHQFKHCLIIAGVNSLKHNWKREVSIHSDEQAHILGTYEMKNGKIREGGNKQKLEDLQNGRSEYFLITNIESLRSKEIAAELEKLCKNGTIGMVIIDEIHKAKNPQSQQGKSIHKLQSFYKMALTGTPLMNKPLDLYNILKWLDVEKNSFYRFRSRYCVMGGFGGYEVVGYKNMSELRERVERIMLRRKKEDVLNLPPKIRQTEYVEMYDNQKSIYREVLASIKTNIDKIALSPNPLAQLIRLRQATGYPGILSDKVTESAKMDRMVEFVEELAESGQKAIVFSNWEEITKVARERLKQFNPAYITGSTKDRQSEVDKFQNDKSCKVIVGTIGAMGTGLTLTAASTVIFLDKPWNMANTEQAEDRAHRIGTTGTVNIITLVCKDTIDERIEEIIYEKKELAEALVDGKLDALSKSKLVDMLLS